MFLGVSALLLVSCSASPAAQSIPDKVKTVSEDPMKPCENYQPLPGTWDEHHPDTAGLDWSGIAEFDVEDPTCLHTSDQIVRFGIGTGTHATGNSFLFGRELKDAYTLFGVVAVDFENGDFYPSSISYDIGKTEYPPTHKLPPEGIKELQDAITKFKVIEFPYVEYEPIVFDETAPQFKTLFFLFNDGTGFNPDLRLSEASVDFIEWMLYFVKKYAPDIAEAGTPQSND